MLKAFFLGGAMAATFILLFSFMGIFGSMVSVLTPYKCAASTAAFALPSYQCCQFAFCSADFVGLESSLRLPVWHQAHRAHWFSAECRTRYSRILQLGSPAPSPNSLVGAASDECTRTSLAPGRVVLHS